VIDNGELVIIEMMMIVLKIMLVMTVALFCFAINALRFLSFGW